MGKAKGTGILMKYTFSPDVLALNPGIKKKSTKPASRKVSQLEEKFILLWSCLNGPRLDRETRFHPTRRWRFDFCYKATKTAIEIEGGTRSNGRHSRHAGFREDAYKYNAAQVLGWTVFRLTYDMITTDKLQEIIDYVNNRLAMAAGGDE